MLSQLWSMVQLGGGALVIAALAVELARRPIMIVGATLAVYAWTLVSTSELTSTRIAGISVNVVDVVNVVALAAALIRMRRGPLRWQWALLAVVVLVVIGALRGAIQLGDAALLGFRSELYFVIPALIVTTIPRSSMPRIVRMIVVLGSAIAVVAVGRWIALAMGLSLTPLAASSGYAIERVINSASSLWIALAVVSYATWLLHEHADGRRWMIWAASGFTMLVVLFSQHRSVWLATAAMLALGVVVTRRRWFMKMGIVTAAALGIVAIASLGPDDVGVAGDSLAMAASDDRTWVWRIERWQAIWATHEARGAPAVLFGSGYGYAWLTGAVGVWEASPHNGYLQIAVRLGLLGAILVYVPHLVVLVNLRSATDASSRVVWLWIVGTLIYYVPYSATPLTGVVLGAAVALLQAERTSHVGGRKPVSAEATVIRSMQQPMSVVPTVNGEVRTRG